MAVDEYCDRKGYDEDMREDMHFFTRVLDTAYLKHQRKKAKEHEAEQAAKRRGKRGKTSGD